MEFVLSFLMEARFKYEPERTVGPVTLSQVMQQQKEADARRDCLKAVAAIYQARKPSREVQHQWLVFSNRYLAADRVSMYVERSTSPRFMLYKDAARH